MLLGLPFAFAEHLDPCAIHQQVQTRRGRHCADSDLQCFLPPAYRAVVRHRPGEPSEVQQGFASSPWPDAVVN